MWRRPLPVRLVCSAQLLFTRQFVLLFWYTFARTLTQVHVSYNIILEQRTVAACIHLHAVRALRKQVTVVTAHSSASAEVEMRSPIGVVSVADHPVGHTIRLPVHPRAPTTPAAHRASGQPLVDGVGTVLNASSDPPVVRLMDALRTGGGPRVLQLLQLLQAARTTVVAPPVLLLVAVGAVRRTVALGAHSAAPPAGLHRQAVVQQSPIFKLQVLHQKRIRYGSGWWVVVAR